MLAHKNQYICTALFDFLQLRFNSVAKPATILESKQSNMVLLKPGLAVQKYTLRLSGYPRAPPFWIRLNDMDPKWSAARGRFHVTPARYFGQLDRQRCRSKKNNLNGWVGGGMEEEMNILE